MGLKTALGNYPHTRSIKSGELRDARVSFDFVQIEPVHDAFMPMVRNLAFDLSEMAVVTALQAFAYGKPIILLPMVVSSRFQRGCMISYKPRGIIDPRALVGQRVGVRAFTQTTGMWVRAALYQDYGLDHATMRWVTREEAHVAEYRNPPFVEHDTSGKSLPQQLRDGDIAAAIMGNDLPRDADFVRVIADHEAADRAWHDRHGFMPINHMVVARATLVEENAEAVRAAYALLRQGAIDHPSPSGTPSRTMFGAKRLLAPLQYIIDECHRQALLPCKLAATEVLEPSFRLLGD